eukprot:7625798-Pyramimonas_sp.AAC.1
MRFGPKEFKPHSRAGLGALAKSWALLAIRHCLFAILVAVRFHEEAPLIWHCSQASTLSKANGKADCAGLRLVRGLDLFGKACYQYLWRANPSLPYEATRHYARGYLKHRRREGAILVQNLAQERLREAGLNCNT